MKKKVLIPIFLAAMALPVCLNKGAGATSAEWIGEVTNKNNYLEFGYKVNAQMADEGFVLLKNRKDDSGKAFLPMAGDEKVSLVGKNSVKIARGGGGSGDAQPTKPADAIDFQQSLKNAGFDVNPTAISFYEGSSSGSGRKNGNDNSSCYR